MTSRPVNRGLARRDRHESLPWSVAQNGRFCQFWHPDPTWQPRGARMPENLREPSCIGPLGSLYSKGTGLAASPLPSYGPAEGSILDLFEPKSGWAETAHFQPPTPRGYWRGHISGSEGSWDEPSEEHREPLSVGLGAHWLPGTRLWLVGTPLPWQGSRVNFGQVRGLCLNPRTCAPLRRWDPGVGYGWGLSVYCPEVPLPQSMA